MKIAVATQELTRIDAHLAWARHILLFEVTAEGIRSIACKTFPAGQGPQGLTRRLRVMTGCRLIFLADAGPAGEKGLAGMGIMPVRSCAGQSVAEALDAFRDRLRRNPKGWLRREQQAEHRTRNKLPPSNPLESEL
jgi:nitrogen fixation protein NifX